MNFMERLKTGVRINLQSVDMLWRNKQLLLYLLVPFALLMLSIEMASIGFLSSYQGDVFNGLIGFVIIPFFIFPLSYHTAQIAQGKSETIKNAFYICKTKIKKILFVAPISFLIFFSIFFVFFAIMMSYGQMSLKTILFLFTLITMPFLFFPAIVLENKPLLQTLKFFLIKTKNGIIELITISITSIGLIIAFFYVLRRIPLPSFLHLTGFFKDSFIIIIVFTTINIFIVSTTILYIRTEK